MILNCILCTLDEIEEFRLELEYESWIDRVALLTTMDALYDRACLQSGFRDAANTGGPLEIHVLHT